MSSGLPPISIVLIWQRLSRHSVRSRCRFLKRLGNTFNLEGRRDIICALMFIFASNARTGYPIHTNYFKAFSSPRTLAVAVI